MLLTLQLKSNESAGGHDMLIFLLFLIIKKGVNAIQWKDIRDVPSTRFFLRPFIVKKVFEDDGLSSSAFSLSFSSLHWRWSFFFVRNERGRKMITAYIHTHFCNNDCITFNYTLVSYLASALEMFILEFRTPNVDAEREREREREQD